MRKKEGLGVAYDADNSNMGYDLIWIHHYTRFSEYDKKLSEFLFPVSDDTWVADPFGKAKLYSNR